MLDYGKVFVTEKCFDSRGDCYSGYFDGEIVGRRWRSGRLYYYVIVENVARWYEENNVV